MSTTFFDPGKDPTPGNRMNPATDYGRAPDGPWHALAEAWGTYVDAVCGARIYKAETRQGRPEAVCPDCARAPW